MMNKKITIRSEEHKDYKSIISLILRSFQEGTDYSDGTDIIALVFSLLQSSGDFLEERRILFFLIKTM